MGNPYSLYNERPRAAKSGGHSGGLLGKILGDTAGVVTHLGTDLKDATFGLPTGAVNLVEHPIKSVKEMGVATWHDWSPLIHGDFKQFAHQTYEHPLAPLLDIATVFSAGAGAAGKLGKLAEAAGSDSRLAKAAADLGRAKTVKVTDQGRIAKGETPRPPLPKTYGGHAGANLRRAIVNKALGALESHGRVPKMFEAQAREGRLYNRLHYIDLAHRHAAMNFTINRLMAAGKLASDPNVQHIIQPHVLSQNYWQMRKFAPKIGVNDALPSGYTYVHELTDPAMFDAQAGVTLESRLRNFGKDAKQGGFTTNSVKNAAKVDGGKNVLIVPHHTLKSLGIEGAESTKALRKFAHSPVTWWKRIQVGYAPRVITNNVMGNWIMYALRTMGSGGGRAVVDAVRHAHGERAAMSAFKEMRAHIAQTQGADAAAHFTALAHPHMIDAPNVAAIEKTYGKRVADAVRQEPNWVTKHFKTELGSTFGNVLHTGEQTREGRLLREGFYPAVHRFADRPVRVAALYHFMRNAPEVKRFLDTHPGVTLDDAIDRVLTKNPNSIRQRAETHVRSIAGDYSTMGPRERVMQNIVPFYLWDKHIVKHVANMVNERPAALAGMDAVGREGTGLNQKILGALPEFMQGALPLSLLGAASHGGRTPLLMTTGMNPYHTVGDLAQAITAATTRHDLTSGADAANNLSPLITGLVEQISGHKIGTQAPAQAHGGIIPSVLADTALGTSYGSLIQRLLGNTPKPKPGTSTASHPFGNPKPFLYTKTPAEVVGSLFGVPIKYGSLERAHQMADQETGRKKKRRTSTNPFGA